MRRTPHLVLHRVSTGPLRPALLLPLALAAGCLALGAGCTVPAVAEPDPIVVVMVIDTLGQAMAEHSDTCGALQAEAAAYGLTLTCLAGGVAPSSWTAESHTRFLWPQTTVGSLRALEAPPCDSPSMLETLADGVGARYLWAADNLVLSSSQRAPCDDGGQGNDKTSFSQGSHKHWETHATPEELAPRAEAEHPVHDAIARFGVEVAAAEGRGLVVFLNLVEPGGHRPRCWFDPHSPACDELWQLAVAEGFVLEDDERADHWLNPTFYNHLQQVVAVERADEEDRWRPLFWQTTADNVAWYREELLLGRLRAVLEPVAAAGRLDDLQLVVLGDHGENPCVAVGLGDPTLNCGHNGLTTPYTGFVPAYVAPASLADDWTRAGLVGARDQPWSTVNLAYGLLDASGLPPPADWPDPEPVGGATSWTCQAPGDAGASGVRVEGEVAIACNDGVCATTTFTVPEDEWFTGEPVDAPDLVAAWGGASEGNASEGGASDWFSAACSGE